MKINFLLLQIILLATVPFLLGSMSSIDITDTIRVEEIAGIPANQNIQVEWSGDVSKLPIIGTWINADYNNDGRSARVDYIAGSDGTISYAAFDKADGSGNVYKGTVKYLERWTDTEGRQCGKSIVTLDLGMSWETLDRISADGKTLEVQSGVSEIDPKGPRYSVYYRK
ncbi:MAG: hypothetical protein JW822_04635 [Spirochaetales bacterium]|nr:hypothetical protein [Spirochaetales bacterium]